MNTFPSIGNTYKFEQNPSSGFLPSGNVSVTKLIDFETHAVTVVDNAQAASISPPNVETQVECYQLSLMKDEFDLGQVATTKVYSWHDLEKVITTRDWAPGTFRSGKRLLTNFDKTQFLVLDIDGEMPLDEAKSRFAGYKHIIATSRNHQKIKISGEKEKPACDRFRVVLFLDKICTDKEAYKAGYKHLVSEIPGLDPSCCDASRFFYKSPGLVSANPSGKTVELAPAKVAIPKPALALTPVVEDASHKIKLAKQHLAKMTPAIEGSQGHLTTWNAALDTVVGFDLTAEQAYEALQDYNDRCQPPWGVKELWHKIADAENKATAPRGYLLQKVLWEPALLKNKQGSLKPNLANAITILKNDDRWKQVLAFDEFAGRTIIKTAPPSHSDRKSTYPRHWRDEDDVLTCAWLQQTWKEDFGKETTVNAVECVARDNPVHPVRDYLDGLVWDGVARLDNWLATYLGANAGLYEQAVGSTWMLSAVARVYEPGCKADNVLILEGGQGIGKSTALKVLAGGYFVDELADLGSKDCEQQLQGAWIVELAELDSLGRAEITKIKAFFTKTVDRFRSPYGRIVEEHPRQCVFAGTVNHNEYLRDETGNRRFFPVHCRAIETERLKTDRDQLWAEAVCRYKQREDWWLSREQESLAKLEQEARLESDSWEESIGQYLAGSAGDFVTKDQILSECLGISRDRHGPSEQKRVARCLKKLGWHRCQRTVDGKKTWVYAPAESPDINLPSAHGGDKKEQ